ncbi:hypothetical protein Psta_3265 [Pirellula staleyi DSM 6068]|uniref:Uncharacterized protein n=1 Tax=Pirellula staleyi (strain ATCC 27377 / DSM 6068 / ICPB 4128) TaxID=530564 RepID=D2QX89_PIRSD|nr:hypothetical protein [Pirellula staleyi]ADB17929.1 hypothetical protein Psta_3265 [Pirellula staleyi DSM 6068]
MSHLFIPRKLSRLMPLSLATIALLSTLAVDATVRGTELQNAGTHVVSDAMAAIDTETTSLVYFADDAKEVDKSASPSDKPAKPKKELAKKDTVKKEAATKEPTKKKAEPGKKQVAKAPLEKKPAVKEGAPKHPGMHAPGKHPAPPHAMGKHGPGMMHGKPGSKMAGPMMHGKMPPLGMHGAKPSPMQGPWSKGTQAMKQRPPMGSMMGRMLPPPMAMHGMRSHGSMQRGFAQRGAGPHDVRPPMFGAPHASHGPRFPGHDGLEERLARVEKKLDLLIAKLEQVERSHHAVAPHHGLSGHPGPQHPPRPEGRVGEHPQPPHSAPHAMGASSDRPEHQGRGPGQSHDENRREERGGWMGGSGFSAPPMGRPSFGSGPSGGMGPGFGSGFGPRPESLQRERMLPPPRHEEGRRSELRREEERREEPSREDRPSEPRRGERPSDSPKPPRGDDNINFFGPVDEELLKF